MSSPWTGTRDVLGTVTLPEAHVSLCLAQLYEWSCWPPGTWTARSYGDSCETAGSSLPFRES